MDERDRLIRLETKLDGIQTTLDVRLNHLESRIGEVVNDLQSHERHLKVEMDKKASREELTVVSDIAKAARDAISKVGWTVVLTVLGAVLALVVGDRLIP